MYYGLVFCLFSWPYMVKWHNSGIIIHLILFLWCFCLSWRNKHRFWRIWQWRFDTMLHWLIHCCVCVCVCVCGSEVDLVIREGCHPFCSVCHKRGYEPKKKITRAFRPINHPSYCNISYDVSRCCLKHVSKYNKLEFNQYLTFLFINIIWPKNSNLSMGEGTHA